MPEAPGFFVSRKFRGLGEHLGAAPTTLSADGSGGCGGLVSTVVSGLVQVIIFSLIPLIAYLATARKRVRFLEYVGLKAAPGRAVVSGALLGALSLPVLLGLVSLSGAGELLRDPASQTGRLREVAESMGVAAMLWVALFQAAVTTALSEEILFRGFLAKRLIAWLGFGVGNAAQAIVFGAVHGLLFLGASTEVSLAGRLAVVLVPTVQGWLMGWLNERAANGSIVPSWCAHAVTNGLTFTLVPLVL